MAVNVTMEIAQRKMIFLFPKKPEIFNSAKITAFPRVKHNSNVTRVRYKQG